MRLILIVVLSLTLTLGYQVERGCEEWTLDPSSRSRVCCKTCKPGNRMVSECGSDPRELCERCMNGTYTLSSTSVFCKTCTECISPLRVKTLCHASSDTVCECEHGFQCGDEACSYCVQQCGQGQEPTHDRGCRPCPAGTFNHHVHHRCIKWSSSCPLPNQHIVAAGTATSDIICADVQPSSPPTTVSYTHTPDNNRHVTDHPGTTHGSGFGVLVITIICACLTVSFAMLLRVAMYFTKEKTLKTPPRLEEPLAAGRRLRSEPEQCSFCFPQEEHGSHSSLLPDDKPFELVV